MRYLVAADGNDLESRVSKRFGHAICHLLVDPATWHVRCLTGSVEGMPQHGLERFEHRTIQGVISGNIGPHAFDDIVNSGLKVYIVRGVTVREAVEQVVAGNVAATDAPTLKQSVHEGRKGSAHP